MGPARSVGGEALTPCLQRQELDFFDATWLYKQYLFICTDPEHERTHAPARQILESMKQVVTWYNQRGDCSENRIKELKIGFGMQRMPCEQFAANAVFFRIGVLAYNVGRLFVLKTLDGGWHRHQVQTLRWKIYETAGKIIFRGGSIRLKVRRQVRGLFAEIRARKWQFANS